MHTDVCQELIGKPYGIKFLHCPSKGCPSWRLQNSNHDAIPIGKQSLPYKATVPTMPSYLHGSTSNTWKCHLISSDARHEHAVFKGHKRKHPHTHTHTHTYTHTHIHTHKGTNLTEKGPDFVRLLKGIPCQHKQPPWDHASYSGRKWLSTGWAMCVCVCVCGCVSIEMDHLSQGQLAPSTTHTAVPPQPN